MPATGKRCGHHWCSDCRKTKRRWGNRSNRRNRHLTKTLLKKGVE